MVGSYGRQRRENKMVSCCQRTLVHTTECVPQIIKFCHRGAASVTEWPLRFPRAQAFPVRRMSTPPACQWHECRDSLLQESKLFAVVFGNELGRPKVRMIPLDAIYSRAVRFAYDSGLHNTLKQHNEILRKMFEIHCRRVKFLDPRPLIESPNTSHCPSQASQSHECDLSPCDSLRRAGPA